MIIDTHAHYDDEAFLEDQAEILNNLKDKGVEIVINAAASMEGCKRTLALIGEYPFVYGMLGVHPDDVGDMSQKDIDFMKQHAKEEKIVAIGEIGLDYHWDIADREVQKHWFLQQMALARDSRESQISPTFPRASC